MLFVGEPPEGHDYEELSQAISSALGVARFATFSHSFEPPIEPLMTERERSAYRAARELVRSRERYEWEQRREALGNPEQRKDYLYDRQTLALWPVDQRARELIRASPHLYFLDDIDDVDAFCGLLDSGDAAHIAGSDWESRGLDGFVRHLRRSHAREIRGGARGVVWRGVAASALQGGDLGCFLPDQPQA